MPRNKPAATWPARLLFWSSLGLALTGMAKPPLA